MTPRTRIIDTTGSSGQRNKDDSRDVCLDILRTVQCPVSVSVVSGGI